MDDIVDFVRVYIDDLKILEETTNEITMSLENNIKDEAPYDQGRLRRSIRVDTRIYEDYSIITGYWDEGLAPHGEFVLMGTRPHEILPKNKKALSWDGMAFDYPVRRVMHPGTKPDDFLGRGLEQTVRAYR